MRLNLFQKLQRIDCKHYYFFFVCVNLNSKFQPCTMIDGRIHSVGRAGELFVIKRDLCLVTKR